jgi:septum formation topological specificity factor MinE
LIGRHAAIDANKVHFMVVRGNTASTLTVDIEVPFRARPTGTRYEPDRENAFSYP